MAKKYKVKVGYAFFGKNSKVYEAGAEFTGEDISDQAWKVEEVKVKNIIKDVVKDKAMKLADVKTK